MSNVEFNEEAVASSSSYTSRSIELGKPMTPASLRLIQKWHLAKTEKQAYYILIGFILGCFIAAFVILNIFIFHLSLFHNQPTSIPPEVLKKLPINIQNRIKAQKTN